VKPSTKTTVAPRGNAPKHNGLPKPDTLAQNPLKRKRDVPQNENEKKLNEFLGVMQATAKSKTWQNEVTDGAENTPVIPEQESDASDDELQVIGDRTAKKSKKTSILNRPEDPAAAAAVELLDPKDMAEKLAADKAKSDAEWLRSKTSRVLEDSDDEGDLNMEDAVAVQPENSADLQLDPSPEKPLDDEDANSNPEESSENVTKIQEHGRLYVRNLAFTITEDELRDQFGSYGSLEEVSSFLLPQPIVLI
jgi:multiple RNA-binding domain-containing protein 1